MIDAGDILMNDGALVEVGGIVRGGADQFDPAGMLVVGLGRYGGQEGVVDVDDRQPTVSRKWSDSTCM